MLPKSSRLTSEELKKMPRKGAYYFSSPYFSARFTPAARHAKFAVVVSKKVARSAVARNKLRRRFYAALAQTGVATLPVSGVIYVKKEAAALPFSVLKREWEAYKKSLTSLSASGEVSLKT